MNGKSTVFQLLIYTYNWFEFSSVRVLIYNLYYRKRKEEIFAKELSIKEFLREGDPPVMSGQVGFCKARGQHEKRRKYKKELKKHIEGRCEGSVPDVRMLKLKLHSKCPLKIIDLNFPP